MESTAFLLGEPKALAAGVRQFRAKYDLSQAELSVLSGISLRTVQYLEGERVTPNPLTLMRLDSLMRRYERAQKKVTV